MFPNIYKNMSCSAAEIEAKRRRAKELLQRRKLSTEMSQIVSNNSTNVTPNLNGSSCVSAEPTFFPKATKRNFVASNFDISPQRERSSNKKVYSNSNNSRFNTKSNFNSFINDKIQATCVLLPSNKFQVKLSKYFNPAIDVMKTIPSKSYEPKSSNWNFSLDHYDMLLSKFETLQSHLNVNKLPIWIHTLTKMVLANGYHDFSKIDDELRNALMPFQEESLGFAVERNGRCLIADEMGLGKTIQALAISAYYREDWPMVIITTASTCSSWEISICKFLPSISLMNIHMLGSKTDYLGKPKVIISSYDMMNSRVDELLSLKCGVCIFDESHTLKNFKTKSFKSASALARQAKRVILLSGTPALSKPSELFTQLQLINETFFINFMEYSKRYCDGKESQFGWDATGQSNLEELQIVLEKRFMIRRTKATMSALQLPDKTQEIIHLNITDADLNVEEKKQFEILHGLDFKKIIKNDQQILPFFHKTAVIKIPAVSAYITQLLSEETRKVILFAHHLIMLDAMEEILVDSGKKFIRIDGRTTDRERLVRMFQTNDNVACALLSITAANSGITLTAAEVVIFTELHWTPSILAQAEARAHRIGQTKPVTIRYLIGSKTVDDYIWPLLQSKQRTLNEMKLTTESYDNFKTVKCKETPPEKPQQSIIKFLTPAKDATGKRTLDAEENTAHRTKSLRLNSAGTFRTDSNDSSTEKRSQEYDDLLNDDLDDFFTNFSTQQLKPLPRNTNDDCDMLDDDMNEFLKAIPL